MWVRSAVVGRFSVRSGDAGEAGRRARRAHRLEQQLDIGQHGDARRESRRRGGVRRGQPVRDAGREDERVEPGDLARGLAQRDVDRRLARLGHVVPGHDVRPHGGERAGSGEAGAAEPDHGEAPPGEEVRREAAHRIFRVASPASARIMEMIQKRMTMVGSAQPFFSK